MNLDGHIPQTKLNSIGSILDNDSRMLNVVDVKTVKMRVKYFDNIPMKKLMKPWSNNNCASSHLFASKRSENHIFDVDAAMASDWIDFCKKFLSAAASSTEIGNMNETYPWTNYLLSLNENSCELNEVILA